MYMMISIHLILYVQLDQESPLWVASFDGHHKCVHLLIEAGANVDVPKRVSVTSMHTSQRPPINMYQSIQ